MATIFNKIFVTKAEYSIIKTMHVSEQLRWLFDTYDSTTKQTGIMDLSAFFKDVKDELEQYNNALPMHVEEIDIKETALPADSNIDFVDVMIDDENIMIESNSLKALRHVKDKFIESGYMLQRDLATEKMFRKDKTTRYIRVFRIINYTSSMCLN
jgi:hypothetical protein